LYDIIEVFTSSLRKPLRCIVHQTNDISSAQTQADRLWKENSISEHKGSTFVVYDRSTSQEIYRVPPPVTV